MEKFCTPVSFGQLNNKIYTTVIPELARKLVEVEYMMRDKPMPKDAAASLYLLFKKAHPDAKDNEFKRFLGDYHEI